MDPLRRIGTVARFVLGRAIVEPIRTGSLRRTDAWPRHLLPFVVVGLVVYTAMTAIAIFAGTLRGMTLVHWGDLSLPWLTLGPFLMAISLVLALAYAAALHVNPWVRVPALLVVMTLATQNPLLVESPMLKLVMAIEVVVLVAFAALRWRSHYSPWEVVVPLAVIGTGLVARMMFAQSPSESFVGAQQVVQIALLSFTVLMWATPSVLMAGAAMAELTISTASWAARGTWEAVMTGRRARPIGAALLGGLVVASVVSAVFALRSPVNTPLGIASALTLFVLTALVGLGVLRFVPRGDRPGVQVDPDDLVQGWPTVSLAVAIVFSVVMFGPFPIDQLLGWWGLSLPVVPGVALQVAALPVALVCGVALARRARPAAAMIVAAVGIHTAYVPLANLAGFPLNHAQSLLAVAGLAVAVLAYLLVTRRLSADRGLAVGSVFIVTTVYPFRSVLDEPFSLLATVSGTTGGLLLGLAWRQLTEYGFTRHDSRGFPAASRVLVGTANLTLVASAVAMHAAAAGSGVMNLGLLENIGDETMGGSLLYAVCAAGLLLALRGREGGDARAGDEFQIFPLLVEEKGPLDELPQAWFDQNVEKTRWR
ncbi:hypothetical protein [Mariniluteicoccus flavus]